KLPRMVTLKELQEHRKRDIEKSPLKDMVLLNRGRLSVQPVSQGEMEFIVNLARYAVPKSK
ncbi:hypothetical protein EV182_003650, partial [Spiromyces aspiralis]